MRTLVVSDLHLGRGDGFVRLSYAGRAGEIVEATARLAEWAARW